MQNSNAKKEEKKGMDFSSMDFSGMKNLIISNSDSISGKIYEMERKSDFGKKSKSQISKERGILRGKRDKLISGFLNNPSEKSLFEFLSFYSENYINPDFEIQNFGRYREDSQNEKKSHSEFLSAIRKIFASNKEIHSSFPKISKSLKLEIK
jgi:hypothetical protein